MTKCIFYFLVPLIAALVKQEKATQTVLEQAEVLSVEWYRFVVIFSACGRADLKGMSLRGGEVTSDFKYLANNEISASSRRSEMGAVGRDSIM